MFYIYLDVEPVFSVKFWSSAERLPWQKTGVTLVVSDKT